MNFKRFQLKNVKVPDDVVCLYGSKSVRASMTHDILKHNAITKGQVYSVNAEYHRQWMPKSVYVSSVFNKEAVAHLFKKQSERKDQAFMLFDDCFEEDLELISRIIAKAKTYNTLVILGFNRGMEIPGIIAKCATCIFIPETENKYDRRDLYDAFGSLFETEKVFYKCLDYLTEDSNMMVICTNDSKDLQRQVYWFNPKESAEVKADVSTDPDASSVNDASSTASVPEDTKEPAAQVSPSFDEKDESSGQGNDENDEYEGNGQGGDENGEVYEERGECTIC